MRNILYILMAVALLTGCKTKYIPIHEYHEIVVHHADTLLRVDSVRVDSLRVPYPVERKQTAWERTMQNVGKISLILIVISICFMLVYLLLRARNKIDKVL